MIKHGEANPLNVFGLRRTSYCHPHFEKVYFELSTNEKDITDWIYENLASRFFFGQMASPDNSSSLTTVVAFESPSEAGYFSLMLNSINK